jgi:hypothetical protein
LIVIIIIFVKAYYPLNWLTIKYGMSYTDVISIIGKPDADLRGTKEYCIWHNDDILDKKIEIYFKYDKVVDIYMDWQL